MAYHCFYKNIQHYNQFLGFMKIVKNSGSLPGREETSPTRVIEIDSSSLKLKQHRNSPGKKTRWSSHNQRWQWTIPIKNMEFPERHLLVISHVIIHFPLEKSWISQMSTMETHPKTHPPWHPGGSTGLRWPRISETSCKPPTEKR